MKKLLLALILAIFTVTAYGDERNYLIVLDTSGSMSDRMQSDRSVSRMAVAQNALIDVLSKLPEGTNVGVYTFNGWAFEFSSSNGTNKNGQTLEEAIRATRPGGGTPLYESLQKSTTEFLKWRASKGNTGSYKIIVVTDGAASDAGLNRERKWNDGSPKPGVLRDIMNRGIEIDTIGLDMEGDHPLSQEINGKYMRGDDKDSLTQSLAKAVSAEIGGSDGSFEFDEISELPNEFVTSAITGLTTIQNQPIGERPYIPVKNEDGTISMVPQEAPQNGGGFFTIIIICCVVAVIVCAIIFRSIR